MRVDNNMIDKDFFIKFQKQIVWIFNTRIGKWFFNIDPPEKIVKVYPSGIEWKNPDGTHTADFHSSNRFAYRMNTAIGWFLPFIRWEKGWIPQFQMGMTVTDFFPAAGNNSPVDGRLRRAGIDETFATIIVGAGTAFNTTDANAQMFIFASPTSNQYAEIRRVIHLYDISAIAGATIDSAVQSFHSPNITDQLLGKTHDNSRAVLVATTPNANNTLQNSDYEQFGAVSFGESVKQTDMSSVAYNDITVLSAGITHIQTASDGDGIVKLGYLYKWEFLGVTTGLTWGSGKWQETNIRMADTSGTSQDPKLTITFTPVVVDTGNMFMMFN